MMRMHTHYATARETETQRYMRAVTERVIDARPAHTIASLAAQRQRIQAWVHLWTHDRDYRRQVLNQVHIHMSMESVS